MKIRFVQDSYYKRQTKQASELSDLEKFKMEKGREIDTDLVQIADNNHILFELKTSKGSSYRWYAYQPHVEIVDDSGKLLTLNHQDISNLDTTAPQVGSIKIPDIAPAKSGQVYDIPGVGKMAMQDPIILNGHFTWDEATHGGTRIPTNRDHVQNIIRLARTLEPYRKKLGKPFHITSWYRPEPYNSRAGGASNSQHLYGSGADFWVDGMSKYELYDYFHPTWQGGLGIYPNLEIIHLDVRNYYCRW